MNDQLAVKRTLWALERTQLAWIRTTFALTSAGIAIDKGATALYQAKYIQSTTVVSSSFYIGTALTIYATLQLAASTIQYVHRERELSLLAGIKPSLVPTVLPLSILVMLLCIGVTLFLAAVP